MISLFSLDSLFSNLKINPILIYFLDENIPSGTGSIINKSTPKNGKLHTPNTKQKLTFNIPSSSSGIDNSTPIKNHITPHKNTPGTSTPSKNSVKNVMFLSPLKSSRKNKNLEGEVEGEEDKKGKIGNVIGNSTYAMITNRNEIEEEDDVDDMGGEEEEQSILLRQKRRRR